MSINHVSLLDIAAIFLWLGVSTFKGESQMKKISRTKRRLTGTNSAPTPLGTSKKTAEALTEMRLSSVESASMRMKLELMVKDRMKNRAFREAMAKAKKDGRDAVEKLLADTLAETMSKEKADEQV